MSLFDCLKQAGAKIVPADKKTLNASVRAYMAEGVPQKDAEIQAVRDLLEQYESERGAIISQITDQYEAAHGVKSEEKQPTLAPVPTLAEARKQVVAKAQNRQSRTALEREWNLNYARQEDGTDFNFGLLDSDLKQHWQAIPEMGGVHTQDAADALVEEQKRRNKGEEAAVPQPKAAQAVEAPKQATVDTNEQVAADWDENYALQEDGDVVNYADLGVKLQARWKLARSKGENTQALADSLVKENKRVNAAPTIKEALAETKAQERQPVAPTLKEAKNKPKTVEAIANEQQEIHNAKDALRLRAAKLRWHIQNNDYTEQQVRDAWKALEAIAHVIENPLNLNYQKILKSSQKLAEVEVKAFDSVEDTDELEGSAPHRVTHDLTSLRAALDDFFGAANVARAIKNGKLVLYADGKALPQEVKQKIYNRYGFKGQVGAWYPSTIYGWYKGTRDGNGQVYLVAAAIDKENTIGKILHEIGAHAGMEALIGASYGTIIKDLQAVQKRNTTHPPTTLLEKTVAAASARITPGTPEANKPHELIAYFVEEGAKQQLKLPLWKRIVSSIKEWAYKHGFVFNVDSDTGFAAIMSLAHGAANSWIISSIPPKSTPGGGGSKNGENTLRDVLNKNHKEAVKYAEHSMDSPNWVDVTGAVLKALYTVRDKLAPEVAAENASYVAARLEGKKQTAETNYNTSAKVREYTRLKEDILELETALAINSRKGDVENLPGEAMPGAVRMAEHMFEMETLARQKNLDSKIRALRKGAAVEGHLHSEIGKWLSKTLRSTSVGNRALDYGASVLERVAVPMNETLNKNYFGQVLKRFLLDHDALTNNAKANYSKFFEDIYPLSLIPFSGKQTFKSDFSNAAVVIRVMSDDMQGVVAHNKQLQEKFAALVKEFVAKTSRTVDIETLFEKLSTSKEVAAINDLFWNTAIARQPEIKSGKLRAAYWRLDAKNNPVEAETDTHTFEYSDKALEIAKKSHKLLTIAALERAISQQHKYGSFAEKLAEDVGNALYLRRPSEARSALSELINIHYELYAEDKNKAKQFIAAIQKHVAAQEQGKDTTHEPGTNDTAYIAAKETVDKMSRGLNETNRKKLQARLSALFNNTATTRAEAASFLDRSIDAISQFYVAHQRVNKNRVYTRLVDAEGRPVQVNFDQYPAFVMGFEQYQEANDFAEWFNTSPETSNVWFDVVDRSGEAKQAKIVTEAVRNDYEDIAGAAEPWFDLFTFTSQLRRTGVNLTAPQRESLVKSIANRTAKQLKATRYRAAKGADKDIWRAYAAYLNGNAYIVANNYTQTDIDDVLYKHSWAPYEIERQLEAVSLLDDSPEKTALMRDLTEGLALTKENASYANNVHDLAKSVLAEYRAQAGHAPNIMDNAMHAAATSYLIGNVSTAVTQVMSLPILTISYLGAKHGKTGFGGGYGFTQAAKELSRSLMSMAKLNAFLNPGNATKPFHEVLMAKINAANLSPREKLLWNYVAREVKEGKLQIGQVMSVTDMYWKGIDPQGRKTNKYIEMFMKPFALSEAYIRMASWVTAYNLAWNKLSKSEQDNLLAKNVAAYTDPVFKQIAREADETVEHTQGIYSQWARSPLLQHGWARALTMFMHYPLVQVNLLRAMPLAGKSMYLALLVAMAGADGLPFKEDLENLIDALAGRFPEVFGRMGTKAFSGNIKDWYVDVTNGLVGEAGGEILRKGLITNMLGMDVSSKLGFNNFTRGLDAGQYGDVFALLGPVGGFFDGALTSTGNMGNAVMAAALGRDPSEYLVRTLKTLPVSALRNMANGVLMAQTGEMRTRAGATVAANMDAWDSLHQFLGWRPIEGVNEYAKRDRMQVYKDLRQNIIRSYNNQIGLAKAEGDFALAAHLQKEAAELTAIYRDANIPIVVNIDMHKVNEIAKQMREPLTTRAMHKLPKEMQRYFEDAPNFLETDEGVEDE